MFGRGWEIHAAAQMRRSRSPSGQRVFRGWIIQTALTLLLQHCQQHENTLLISYFITCFYVATPPPPTTTLFFFPWNPINRAKELHGTTRINYSSWLFTADSWEFLWILKSREQQTDQMCYIALIWQTSLGLKRLPSAPTPLSSLTRRVCQELAN